MSTIEFSVVPARDGFEWVRITLRLFRAQWLRYTSLAALFLLIMQFSSFISSGLLLVFLKPILSVGFLAAAWHHERGQMPETKHLFAGFKSNLKALLPLGFVYMFGVFVAAALAVAIQGTSVEQLMPADGQPKLSEPELMRFMITTLAFTLPVNAALWFAPALIVFSDASFGQALLLSLRAWTRNILAISVYALSMFGLMVLSLAAVSPLLLFLSGSAQVVAVMIVAVPITAIVMTSDYVSYRRVFHRNERLTPLSNV
jgi:hypothetical protein